MDPNKNRIASWFEMQFHAIGTCLDAGLAEAALALIYSGIDTFGFLTGHPAIEHAGNDTFKPLTCLRDDLMLSSTCNHFWPGYLTV